MRAGGPGGQSVNTTDSAVRITHLPTGLVVQCQDEKSQHKNKAKAMKVLRSRLLELRAAARRRASAPARAAPRSGSGERSEKIRTYNFPQNRITDHRAGVTLHKLDHVLEGDLDELLDAVTARAVRGRFDGADPEARVSRDPGDADMAEDRTWTVLELLRWTRATSPRRASTRRVSTPSACWPTPWASRACSSTSTSRSPSCPTSGPSSASSSCGGARERVPVAQLLGEREFWSLRLRVSADVLTPRPETETLVEAALARLPDPGAAAPDPRRGHRLGRDRPRPGQRASRRARARQRISPRWRYRLRGPMPTSCS